MNPESPSIIAQPEAALDRRCLTILLLAALVVRLSFGILGPDHFRDDRDAYLVLAQGIREGRGFSSPDSMIPTAYRPPLYPLLIAPISDNSNLGWYGRLIFHGILALIMIGLTWRAGAALGLSCMSRCLASLLLIGDPLLLLYANFPMTETLCAALGAWLVQCSVHRRGSGMHSFLTGVVFGLCVLSRPTFWIAGGLLAAGWGINLLARRGEDSAHSRRRVLTTSLSVTAGVLLMVGPWVIRNQVQLGHPVVMTTHGGYTLLLGNNDDFYTQVTTHSWSTVWEGDGQRHWADRVNRTMDTLQIQHEVDRDAWMSRQAVDTIRRNPVLFAKATLSRLFQFWNIMPGGESVRGTPNWLLGGLALFYLAYWFLAGRGTWFVLRNREWAWLPVLLLPLAFTCVHAVYWSNIRMRAPVLPAVALLAARGLERRQDSGT